MAAKKRDIGQGSMSKVLYIDPKGKEVRRLTASAGFDTDGNRIKVNRNFHGTKREAEKELVALVADVNRGKEKPSGGPTVSEWVKKWFSDHTENDWAPKTVATYRTMLDHYIIPAIGHIPLIRLESRHIEQFCHLLNNSEGVKGKRFTGATQGKCQRILSKLLQDATYQRLIPHNPMKEAQLPRRETPLYKPLHYDELDIYRLLLALKAESLRFQAIVTIALACGMRRGEIIALTWDDINWQQGTINISKSAFVSKGKGQQEKSPKTYSSNRSVIMATGLVDILHSWQTEQEKERQQAGEQWKGDSHIFTNPDGSWMLVDQVSKEWHRFTSSIQIPAGDISLCVENHTRLTCEVSIRGRIMHTEHFTVYPHGTADSPDKRTVNLQVKQGSYTIGLIRTGEEKAFAEYRLSAVDADKFQPDQEDNTPANELRAIITSNGLSFNRKPLPPLPFHGLRHTHASIARNRGVDITVISKLLGHAQVSTTLNIYTHMLQSGKEHAANVMDEILRGK